MHAPIALRPLPLLSSLKTSRYLRRRERRDSTKSETARRRGRQRTAVGVRSLYADRRGLLHHKVCRRHPGLLCGAALLLLNRAREDDPARHQQDAGKLQGEQKQAAI